MTIPIDVGSGAINRNSTTSGFDAWTWWDLSNPANAVGTLDTMEFWFYSDATGVKCGTFRIYTTDYTYYECLDYETIGAVSSGSKQTFSGLNCKVKQDYVLGTYWATGTMESGDAGSSSQITIGSCFTTGRCTDVTLNGISVYATGIAGVIDVGLPPVDRSSYLTYGSTVVDLNNPAFDNGTGSLDIVKFYFSSGYNATGVKVGTFSGSSTKYTSRDYETIGAVTGGSLQTFSGLDIDVEEGDYIGAYYAAGRLERATSGYLGIYTKSGDQFGAGEQTYSLQAGDVVSLYGLSSGATSYQESAAVAVGLSVTASRLVEIATKASSVAIGIIVAQAFGAKNTAIRIAFVAYGLTVVKASAGKRSIGFVLKRMAKFASPKKTVRFIE